MEKSLWDSICEVFSHSPIGATITVIITALFAYVLFSGAIFKSSKEDDKSSGNGPTRFIFKIEDHSTKSE